MGREREHLFYVCCVFRKLHDYFLNTYINIKYFNFKKLTKIRFFREKYS